MTVDDLTGVAEVLASGELAIEGRLTVASNVTLVAAAASGAVELPCVYKPVTGERPLWDFPDGTLAGREVAAYEVSEAAGWHVVPPTVMRSHGPLGPGMCQLWLNVDEDETGPRPWVDVVSPSDVRSGWLPVLRAVDGNGNPVVLAHADDQALRRLAVFDVVVNNADRKGGHVLSSPTGRLSPVVGVDHGVSFHAEPKLRTVLWGWAGSELTDDERADLSRLRMLLDGQLAGRLAALITQDEVDATVARVDALLKHGVLPEPTGRMPVPWPVF